VPPPLPTITVHDTTSIKLLLALLERIAIALEKIASKES
jgi:hypothetical protein